MNQIKGNHFSIEQMTEALYAKSSKVSSNVNTGSKSFGDVLQTALNKSNEVKFSKHAGLRMEERNINLSEAQSDRLNNAVRKADAKGINESLIMLDNMAFIVSVKNNTVITAVTESDERVFTNIDGAIFA